MFPAALATLLAGALLAAGHAAAEPSHGLSIFGDLKYPPDFEHFDYASPDAVKGGSVTLAAIGSYDNLNPFILKGQAATGAGSIYDTLTVNALDEPFSVYGLLAESIETPEDKRWVEFGLRREARWHDGVALTAEDVVWTFDTIKEKGHPFYKSYYGAVAKAEALDPHTVRFWFSEGNNAELPLIMGQMSVMPKHFWEDREFDETTLEPLLGSGPYRFGKIDPGRSVSYERVEDYWGRELPVNVGRDNFDTLRHDYYRDGTVALEALKSGDIDFRRENISKSWATAYDFPALTEGRVVKEELPDNSTQTMQAFVMNLRKPKFQDRRVREALAWSFDFEWMNENLFYGATPTTHDELLPELRDAGDGPARGARARDPRGAPRRDSRHGLHRRVHAAEHRRLRAHAGELPRGAEAVRGGRLEGRGGQDDERRERRGVRHRDDVRLPQLREDRARLGQEPRAARHRCQGARRRQCPVREARRGLRLRRRHRRVAPVGLAGQRADRLLGLGHGERAGGAQPDGHRRPGHRRPDRAHHRRRLARGTGRLGARARQGCCCTTAS